MNSKLSQMKGLLLLVMLFLCTNSPAQATEVEVVTEYLAPFQIKKEDGTLGGFTTEIVNRIFDITNDTSRVNVLPWTRAYSIAVARPNTLIYSIANTPERRHKFHWVGKVKSERFFVWGLRARFKQPLNSVEQAKQYSLAVTKSYNSAHYARKNGFSDIYYTSRDRQSVGMLFKGRVDITLSSELVMKELALSNGYDFSALIKLADVPELNNDLSIAFSQGSDPKLVKRFRLAYDYLAKSGEIQQLRDKWHVFDDQPL